MGIFEAGFEKPSPIQEAAIPVALTGRDILARAKNGTGKTAAFVIPTLEKVDPKNSAIQALILVPTRELALQTSQVCKTLGKHLGLEVVVTTGGPTLRDDILRFGETVHIVVATPGRILDLAGKGVADLSQCTSFVMDEADKLLSPEFTVVIEQLLGYCAPEKQVMLFSATFPMLVKAFKVHFMLFAARNEANRLQRTNTCNNHTKSISWTNSHFAELHNIMPLCKRIKRFTASTPFSANYKSISPSSFAILQTVLNFLLRKSRNLATHVSTLMPKCFRAVGIVSSTTSEMAYVVTLFAQISLHVVSIFKLSTSLSTLISQRTPKPTSTELVDLVGLDILV